MTEIRISCGKCKRVFPNVGVVGTELITCPYCDHVVFEPGRDRK